MDRIYNRAEDKNSANIIVYGKASDNKAYSDAECTMQCTTSELVNAFMKGCIVAIGSDSMYYPVSLYPQGQPERHRCTGTGIAGVPRRFGRSDRFESDELERMCSCP